jgi:hypothetical protein
MRWGGTFLNRLLQLPVGDGVRRERRIPDSDRASVPVQRYEELGTLAPRTAGVGRLRQGRQAR